MAARRHTGGYEQTLERAKRASVAQLLFRCARQLNEQAIAQLRIETGISSLRTAHTLLFPHVDLEGTRLTELARRLGVSKQAVGQLVTELEELGLLERAPDPEDGRARLVRFTARGRRGLLQGLAFLKRLEAELERKVGADTMRSLHVALTALDAELERRGRC